MRAAEWIHVAVFTFFVVLAWVRPLPRVRRVKVTVLGAIALAATLTAALVLPRMLPPLAVSVIRDWLPASLVLCVYWSAGAFFLRVDRDFQARLERLDERLAGPFLRWLVRARFGRWVAEYLELAYLLCYPMIPMSLGALYVLRLGHHADHFWLAVLIPTYVSYGMLPFVQTLPPRAAEEAWLPERPPSAIRRFNLRILHRASIHANTFPSAHVAASTAAALVVGALAPWQVGAVWGAIAVGIGFGTFAGRYHYVADAITGAAVAAGVFAVVTVMVEL